MFKGFHAPACRYLQPKHSVTDHIPKERGTDLPFYGLIGQWGDKDGWLKGKRELRHDLNRLPHRADTTPCDGKFHVAL